MPHEASRNARRDASPIRWYARGWGASAVILGSFAPLCAIHFRHLWENEQYQHFPLVLAAAAYLGWLRSQPPGPALLRRSAAPSRTLLAMAFALLFVASLTWSPVLGMVGAILAVGAMLFRAGGGGAVREFGPVWLLLWLVVPPPLQLDQALSLRLQRLASVIASALLDVAGCNHVLTGHVIEIPSQRFLVEEACSGIRSLFAIIALVAIFVVWQRRPLVHSLLLLAAAPCWAVSVNAARVWLVVLARDRWGADLASGSLHQILGIVVFLVGVFFLFLTDRLLLGFFGPEANAVSGESLSRIPLAAASPVPSPRLRGEGKGEGQGVLADPRSSWLVALCFGLCVSLQAGPFLSEFKTHDLSRRDAARLASQLARLTLPERLGNWTRLVRPTAAQNQGERSLSESYACGSVAADISVAYPFMGWHELTYCYQGNGWSVDSWRRVNVGSERRSGLTDVEVAMTQPHQPRGQHGYLLFSEYDADGEPVSPPKRDCSLPSRLMEEFRNRLLRRTPSHGLDRPTCQLQVLWTGSAPPSPDEQAQARELYAQARALLKQHMKARTVEAGSGP